MQLRHSTFILLFILCCCFNRVDANDITFSHITTENGLSQYTVNTIYQDENGLIWIGTGNGLNRYNGNEIKVYKRSRNSDNTLLHNVISQITGNRNGEIYILGPTGITGLNLVDGRFSVLLQENEVSTVYFNKRLYSNVRNQIIVYDETEKKFLPYYTVKETDSNIKSLLVDKQDNLWIGTEKDGLFCLSEKKELSHIYPKGHIISLSMDSHGGIWAGTWGQGMLRIIGKKVIQLKEDFTGHGLSSNFAVCSQEDNVGNIWIGTINGLNKYNPSTDEFTLYTSGQNKGNLTHSSIQCLIKDNQGTIWTGGYFGSINYFNPEYEIYTHYDVSNNELKGLSSPVIGRMIEDKDNNLWICTDGGGLNFYDRKKGTFRWYRRDNQKNSISQDNVKSLYYDRNNDLLWIATHLGGLNKLEIKTGKFTHYLSIEGDTTSIPNNIVLDIIPYKGQLIVGTRSGVCLFNPETGRCKRLFTDIDRLYPLSAYELFIDYYGTLWISVKGEGVFSYDFKTNLLTNYRHNPDDPSSISDNDISNIMQDHYFNLWFATKGNGIDRFNYETKTFENYDSQTHGLAGDEVFKICESRYGLLWLATDRGLSLFDYSNKTSTNYTEENGFPAWSTTENSMYITQDGELFLGSTHGMISFFEKDLNIAPKPYTVVLDRLLINNKEVKVNDESGILEKELNYSPAIVLGPECSVFSIYFSTSNYIPANKKKIEYRLEGFSDEWITPQDNNIITYTNLNPGKYTLSFRIQESENKFYPQTQLAITILPPFYKTGWAYLCYILLISGIIYFIIRAYRERIRLQESLKYEQQHILDVEQLNQSKLRFFTNISHEFRTPLTLIIGQVEMLLQYQSFTPAIYNKVLGVYKSSVQLRELISELLDFRKQEQGHLKIMVSPNDLVNFLYENYLIFSEYARNKQISLLFIKDVDSLEVWFDNRQMQKVINNLLSNALKHTPKGGEITIRISQSDNQAVIEVCDNGRGMEEKELSRIFDRFYQIENMELTTNDSGTGIGLALTKGIIELHKGTISVTSKPGQGTRFTVSLVLGNNHFTSDQIHEQAIIIPGEKETLPESALSLEQIAMEESKQNRIRNAKMLIVEDNENLREMLVQIFSTFYNVSTAADGLEALEAIKIEMPDIILSDIMMPNMSGTELCKQIKNNIDTCHIPIVLLTARTAIEHNLEGLRMGADDYVTKPFNINLLVSRCNNLVNSRLLLQEKFSKQPQTTPQMLATNPMDKEFMDKIIEIVERNLDNTEFNIDLLAREVGTARTKLFAKIKAVTGQTPNDFILNIRLKKGAWLLRNKPELNISEIADQTGFSSSQYFSTCFKNIYQLTPGAYRKNGSKEESEE